MAGKIQTNREPDPELLRLLEQFKNYHMSPAEEWDQRVSFAYGNLPFRSKTTKEQVIAEAIKIYGPRPAD